MSTTILLVVVLIMLSILTCQMLLYRHRQKEIKEHDSVLFPFCQLRRDIVLFLHQNVFENEIALSSQEKESARRLLDILNTTIQNYNRHKIVMFDLRAMAKHLKKYRDTIKQTEPVDITDNEEIKKFHLYFVGCFAKASLTYTPLIRWELVLRLIMFVSRKYFREYVLVVAKQVRDADDNYSVTLENRAPA